MRKPYLLLNRVDLAETLAEMAKRRAEALAIHSKAYRYEQMLRDELQSMECLRTLMKEPAPRSRWRRQPRIAAE